MLSKVSLSALIDPCFAHNPPFMEPTGPFGEQYKVISMVILFTNLFIIKLELAACSYTVFIMAHSD